MGQNIFPTPATPLSRLAIVSTSTTWDHPDGYAQARPVKVLCIGGGQGGGSGMAGNYTAAVATAGGGGGGSGMATLTDLFVSGTATITIGAKGTGGAAVSKTGSGNTAGIAGSFGGDTIFSASGAYARTTMTDYWVNYNLGSAQGGATGTTERVGGWQFGSGGGYGTGDATITYHKGGSMGNPTGGQQIGFKAITSQVYSGYGYEYAPGGGGGGGGTTTTAALTGGIGGYGYAASHGGAGGNGTRSTTANGTATGTAGANGTSYGAGGGGGGNGQVVNATITSAVSTSGKGGDGGDGVVYIWY